MHISSVLYSRARNGAHTPGLRIANVTNVGFMIRINEVVCQQPGQPTQPLARAIISSSYYCYDPVFRFDLYNSKNES
jgi:hypothetical protein